MIVIQSPRLQLIQFQMMDAQEVFGCITPAIANSCRGSRHREARGNVLAWRHWKTRILFRRNSAFGSRKAHTDRVLAAKSWLHLLSGDTQLSAKEVSSIRWPYKTRPAGVSLRNFTA